MKICLQFLMAIFPVIAFCQTDDMAHIRQELAEDRQQLSVLVRNSPPPAKILSIPGESNGDRAQRHADAIIEARKSWVTEWSAQHPYRTSFDAPPMPYEMEQNAIRDSDAQYVAEHSRKDSSSQQDNSSSQQVQQLQARITSLERLLADRSGTGNASFTTQQQQRPSAQQQQLFSAWKAIKVGMKESDVLATFGKPNSTSGRRWSYSGYGIIVFDASEAVQGVEPLTLGDPSAVYYSGSEPKLPPSHTEGEIGAVQSANLVNEAQTNSLASGAKLSPALNPAYNQSPSTNGPSVSGGLRIIAAFYGADDTFRDVTPYAQDAVLRGSFRADSNTLGGDPIFGKVKTLRIRYELGGQIYEKQFSENSEVRLNGSTAALDGTGNKIDGTRPNVISAGTAPSSAPEPAPKQPSLADGSSVSGILQILSAFYGAEGTFQNVTPFVQNNVRNGNCSMRVGNDTLGGDPIGGKTKSLRIRYQFEGRIYEKTFAEGSEVRIP